MESVIGLIVAGSSDGVVRVFTSDKHSECPQVIKESKLRIVALSECFSCPYGTGFFRKYSKTITDGDTWKALSESVKQHEIYMIGGTIPEIGDNNSIYNPCYVWDPLGNLTGKYRKVHLFDIDIPNGICFKESDTLAPDNQFTIGEFDGHRVGIAICYTISVLNKWQGSTGTKAVKCWFTQLPSTWPLEHCTVSFCRDQGPMTINCLWPLQMKPSRNESSDYVACGHSMVVDTWATILRILFYLIYILAK